MMKIIQFPKRCVFELFRIPEDGQSPWPSVILSSVLVYTHTCADPSEPRAASLCLVIVHNVTRNGVQIAVLILIFTFNITFKAKPNFLN
jgi:hypothetical protein